MSLFMLILCIPDAKAVGSTAGVANPGVGPLRRESELERDAEGVARLEREGNMFEVSLVWEVDTVPGRTWREKEVLVE